MMAIDSKIGWTRSTFNPWIGCTKVSPGCDHCYASVSTPARSLGVKWGGGQPRRRTSEANWRQPLKWNAEAARTGEFWPVFCASLADVFDNEVPLEWRIDLFQLIADTPHLTWLLLTKRIGNAANMIHEASRAVYKGSGEPTWPWANVWLGATIVNQEEADRDIPKLLAVPAAKRFVSYEPALGPIDFARVGLNSGLHFDALVGGLVGTSLTVKHWPAIDWILIGGESDQQGMKARPFNIEWARDTVAQCRAAGVACFVKQLGSNVVRYTRTDAGQVTLVSAEESMTMYTFRDRAGADPAEMPEDLRVQEWPL